MGLYNNTDGGKGTVPHLYS